jgi:hypothetical protein
MGMFPYELMISLDSKEIPSFIFYEYCALILMLWLLLYCHNFRFNCFYVC